MKDPAFLFYSSDFLSGTMLMSDEDVGKYIRLLCLQHQKGHLKEKDMLSICKAFNEEIFSKFKKDENGNYYNERLEYESNKRRAYSESRRNNRMKKEEKEAYEKDMKNICNSYEEHMENENINIDINTIENINKDIRGMGEEEKKPKKKTFEDVFSENQFPEELENTLRDFIDMRKTIKKPMTTRALELLIKNLRKLTNLEDEQIAILNQSIEHSWQTVYPLKTENNHSNSKGSINDFKDLWEEASKENEQARNNTSNNLIGW